MSFGQWSSTFLTLLVPLVISSNPSLEFVAAPALAPPEVQVDAALMEDYQRQLDAAAAAPLPDEEDNDL